MRKKYKINETCSKFLNILLHKAFITLLRTHMYIHFDIHTHVTHKSERTLDLLLKK